ncbi:MAG: hypothetical protein DRN24_02800 [Thermoplasmata archaeon]|nr:MAG: hypothetical protein DRN24_02800 [Thermoplasmata archaeon]
MQLIKITIPIIVTIVLIAGAFTTGILTIQTSTDLITGNESKHVLSENTTNIAGVTADIVIDFGDETKITNTITTKNATVYSFLLESAEINNFNVKATYSSQFDSIIINSISTYENGQDNKYWIYYVNEEIGLVEADKQPVNNGDLIE